MDIQQIISSRRWLDRAELFGELMNRDQPVAMHMAYSSSQNER